MKNNPTQYQQLIKYFVDKQLFLSPTPQTAVIFTALLSWDRMITGIRESGRPMAASGSVT
jgi:hypothetical protein